MDDIVENLIDKHCTHFTILTSNFCSIQGEEGDLLFMRQIEFNQCRHGNTYLFVFEDGSMRFCTIQIEYYGNSYKSVAQIYHNDDDQVIYTIKNMVLAIFELVVRISEGRNIHIRHTCRPIAPDDYLKYHALIAPKYYFQKLPVIQTRYKLFPKKPFTKNALTDIYMRLLNLPLLFLQRVAKYYDTNQGVIENALRWGSVGEICNDDPITTKLISQLALMDLDIFSRYLIRTYRANRKHFNHMYSTHALGHKAKRYK
jgi:hypothetical protein